MDHTYTIATLNINGIKNHNRIRMLDDVIYKHGLDIILLQEVTDVVIENMRGYNVHINNGADGRGTTILAKECYELVNIKRIPTGRGLAGEFKNITIINIYGPSGAEKKRDRDSFYNEDLAKFITHPSTFLILAGDFNCVQSATDCTGTPLPSRPLGNILSGLDLIDAWSPTNGMPAYTHYTSRGVSRLDRIYIIKNLQQRKHCTTTVPVAFTDHHAVILHVIPTTQTALTQ
jgi:exonuclease III